MEIAQAAEPRWQQLQDQRKESQYSTVNNQGLNTVQYSSQEARLRIESLDPRLYRDSGYLPFYIKALNTIGWSRIQELQERVLRDPRLGGPLDKFNPEKVFCWLLRSEMK